MLKERLAYLKLWLGILVVTDLSLIGWLVSHYENAKLLLVVSGITAVIMAAVGTLVLHRRIERHIERLREL
jgi:nitrate reductase gamma subunit